VMGHGVCCRRVCCLGRSIQRRLCE
jgi:hypothetical protein